MKKIKKSPELELECWLQCPKCKKQSKFNLKDILAGKQAKCRLCQTPMEINQAGFSEIRQNLESMVKGQEKKGPN